MTRSAESPEIAVQRGDAPLIVSFPHTGTDIPPNFAERFISPARALDDTDWFIDRLYDFVSSLAATTIRTPLSRSIIDVNRDPSGHSLYPGRQTTDLCPTTTFNGRPLYHSGRGPDEAEIAQRRTLYFAPYHAALRTEIERLRSRHPRIVLYDCHSIRSQIPRLFSGTLPNFNIGTNDGASCAGELTAAVERLCDASSFSRITNGRFKGGYITRHYGDPRGGIHVLQMELAIRGYMVEPARDTIPAGLDSAYAAKMRAVLAEIVATCVNFAEKPESIRGTS
jgi:formiminoglutamase